MALDARHRSSIYDKLVPLLGEDDCNALMSQYLEAEEVVTKDFLRAEMAELRAEFAEIRAEFAELRAEFAGLRVEFSGHRGDVSEALRRQQAWTLGAIAASTAVVSTLVSLV